MARKKKICPHCGKELLEYQNPVPTVDIIIEFGAQGIILIKRKIKHEWALPGGLRGLMGEQLSGTPAA